MELAHVAMPHMPGGWRGHVLLMSLVRSVGRATHGDLGGLYVTWPSWMRGFLPSGLVLLSQARRDTFPPPVPVWMAICQPSCSAACLLDLSSSVCQPAGGQEGTLILGPSPW